LNVSNEALWALISAIVTGVVLRIVGWWAEKNQAGDAADEVRRNEFQHSIQTELEDIRDENKKYKSESDQYRQMYFEALERLHAGGSVKEVVETLKRIESQTQTTHSLFAQHLRDGVYLLEHGTEHDKRVAEALKQIGVDLEITDYQLEKALGAKLMLDKLETDETAVEKDPEA